MGPYGDAAIMVFNPGAAQSVSIDLSSLPDELTEASVVPYDLFTNESAKVPLARNWTVSMRAGEVKAFGGFILPVFAPRKGKTSGCSSDYSKISGATTLQSCFLECARDVQCENVLVHGEIPHYVEAPAPITCNLIGAVPDPSACNPAQCDSPIDPAKCKTLITKLSHVRSCSELWQTPTRAAIGAPQLQPGPECNTPM